MSNDASKNDVKLTELLVEILSRKPSGMAVNQIYNYLSKHDKMFDMSDKKWQGNVRHILSKKPYFKRSDYKEPTQRGKFWVFDQEVYTRAKQKANFSDSFPAVGGFGNTSPNSSFHQTQVARYSPSYQANMNTQHHNQQQANAYQSSDAWNNFQDFSSPYTSQRSSHPQEQHQYFNPGNVLTGCSQIINFNFVPNNFWQHPNYTPTPGTSSNTTFQPNQMGPEPPTNQTNASYQPHYPDSYSPNDPYTYKWNPYNNQYYS